MAVEASADACLNEDEILALALGALGDAPAAEAHLATCATCSALLAGAVRAQPRRAWDALAGQMLGPYRIDAQIGAGGMGAVYRAWDPRLGRAIAVKVLHGDAVDRLAAEARAAAAIDHRAIVAIHDVGIADGIPYVAMELVDGESLRSALASGGLGAARVRELLVELCDALAAAHARGVVHRDLKPENLIAARGGLRILDFGLAWSAGTAALDETEPGAACGTAGYMAPEQARGEPADARADVFAVGAIGFELLTGRRAFPGATHAERLTATLRDTPVLTGDAPEARALAPIISRCLAKQPDERFQSAADLGWALRAMVPGEPAAAPVRLSRRAMLVGGAAAAATGALGFLAGWWRRGGAPDAGPDLQPLTHRVGRVYSARFTRDGSRVVYSAAWDADPVQLHVVDLASGETAALELASADVLAVSPRGELAVSLHHRFVDHQSARGELAIVPLTGGIPRPLADEVQAADFAPGEPLHEARPGATDGGPAGLLAVVRAGERGFRIELPLGTAIVDEPGWLTDVRVSPDGARIAYLRHPDTNNDGGELMIAEVATRSARVVAKDWASIAGIAWDPSGDGLWLTGSREDLTNTMYHAALDGEVAPVPLRATSRLRLHDLTADRRAVVTVDAWRLRAMVGDRDRSQSNGSYVSDLSADGTQVVIGELFDVEAGSGAYLVPYAGGRPLRLGPGFPVAISPSGQRIAANVLVADHLVVYATGSGDAPSIATPGFVVAARWLDERALVARFEDRLWRLSLDGAPVALTPTAGPFALDPARRRCAYVDRSRALRVLDLASGALRALAGDFAHVEVCGWLAEPDAIVIRSTTTPIVLERVEPATGDRAQHLVIQPPPTGLKAVDTLVIHPDGKRYAYSYGQELSELFVTRQPLRRGT